MKKALRSTVVLVLLSGCGGDSPHLRYEAEGIVYFAVETDPTTCRGSLDAIIGFREALRAAGLSPVRESIRYFKYPNTQELADSGHCDRGSACQRDGTVVSSTPVHHHELVHAFADHLFDEGGPLSEGLATALSCDPASLFVSGDEKLDFDEGDGNHQYGRNAALVLALLRHGDYAALREAAKRFWEEASWPEERSGANREIMSEVLREVYDLSLQDLEAESQQLEYPTCVAVGRCDVPPLRQGLDHLESDCEGPDGRVFDRSLGRSIGLLASADLQVFSCTASPGAEPARAYWSLSGDTGDGAPLSSQVERVFPAPRHPHLLSVPSRVGLDSFSARIIEDAYLDSCPARLNQPIDFSVARKVSLALPYAPGSSWFGISGVSFLPAAPKKLRVVFTDALGAAIPPPTLAKVYYCSSCVDSPEDDCELLSFEQRLGERADEGAPPDEGGGTAGAPPTSDAEETTPSLATNARGEPLLTAELPAGESGRLLLEVTETLPVPILLELQQRF